MQAPRKESDSQPSGGYTIAAIDRAMQVLESLAAKPDQGVTELARGLRMTKSLVFRIIRTLEARGYVVRDPDRAVFSLGYRMGALAVHASQQKGLVRAAQPVMDELVQQTSETVNLI
ncbi:MAG: helix-turn-helix domain-containing protein, partial [Rhizobiaceae bacterium]